MNKLPAVGTDRWQLDRHAHIVVFDEPADTDLLTIYDCGAAQKPPSAQIRGNLVNVRTEARIESTPTGYTVRLEETGVLIEQTPNHYVVARS